MKKAIRVLAASILCCVVSVPLVHAEDEVEKKAHPYRAGALRLGAFWVFQIDTLVAVKSPNFPLGIAVDVTKDLGLTDSATVPRAMFSYRFTKHSQLDFDWFSIQREGGKRLERTIDIGRREFEIGVGVEAFTDGLHLALSRRSEGHTGPFSRHQRGRFRFRDRCRPGQNRR
jgi:hypothetical protein